MKPASPTARHKITFLLNRDSSCICECSCGEVFESSVSRGENLQVTSSVSRGENLQVTMTVYVACCPRDPRSYCPTPRQSPEELRIRAILEK